MTEKEQPAEQTVTSTSYNEGDNKGMTELYDSGMLRMEPEPLKMKRDGASGKKKKEEEQPEMTCCAVCSFYSKQICANFCNCCCCVVTSPFGRR